jgi:hypothetical protein
LSLTDNQVSSTPSWLQLLSALVLFGAAFGFVEAVVVVDLRALFEPVLQRHLPERTPGDLFPLIPPDHLVSEEPATWRRLSIEVAREAATLVMLAAVGLAVGHNFRQGFAAFLVAFGVWDLFFYLSLKVLIDWPESLLTWDLLFLLPVPWVAPVIAPMIVALTMIGAGSIVLAQEYAGRPFRLSAVDWSVISAGGLILVGAFCWDFRNILAGALPQRFPWPLFALGEGVGLLGFCRAWGFYHRQSEVL